MPLVQDEFRESFRRRFEEQGLRLVSERVVEGAEASGGVSCLLSVLKKGEGLALAGPKN